MGCRSDDTVIGSDAHHMRILLRKKYQREHPSHFILGLPHFTCPQPPAPQSRHLPSGRYVWDLSSLSSAGVGASKAPGWAFPMAHRRPFVRPPPRVICSSYSPATWVAITSTPVSPSLLSGCVVLLCCRSRRTPSQGVTTRARTRPHRQADWLSAPPLSQAKWRLQQRCARQVFSSTAREASSVFRRTLPSVSPLFRPCPAADESRGRVSGDLWCSSYPEHRKSFTRARDAASGGLAKELHGGYESGWVQQ